MALHAGEHVVVYYVKESHLKSTLGLGGGCDILSILSSAKEHMEFLVILRLVKGTHGGVSAWEIELVRPYFFKSFWVQKFAGTISA